MKSLKEILNDRVLMFSFVNYQKKRFNEPVT